MAHPDTWRLLAATLPDSAGSKWHYETRNRLGHGLADAIRSQTAFSQQDRLKLWCLTVAFCRWFDDGDVKTLSDLHVALLETCKTSAERDEFSRSLELITPGETKRRPDEDYRSASPKPNPDFEESEYPIDDALAVIERGGPLLVSEVAKAIRYVVRTNEARREEIIPRLLAATGNGDNYAVAWSWGDSFVEAALASVVRDVSDDHLWILVNSAQRPNADHHAWLNGTAENLHRVAFARAENRGSTELRRGLATNLSMHIYWAFGGPRWQPLWPPLSGAPEVATWDHVMLKMLAELFRSRSAEVLASAITAMHAFVAVSQANISALFQTLRDDWSQRWLLNAAEAWAALHPDALQVVEPELEEIMRTAQLEPRLQAWVVLCRLADARNGQRPAFPFRPVRQFACDEPRSSHPGILETSPIVRGMMRMLDRHSGAKGKLDRLEACGHDFSDVEGEIASQLLNQSTDENTLAAFKRAPYRDNDLACSGLATESAIDQSIDGVLGAVCSPDEIPRLAQGIFDNEDAWLLRQTPLPSAHPNDWLSDYQIDGLVTASNIGGITERLRTLAATHALPEGWAVAAACVYAATWRDDFAFFMWLEETPNEQHIIAPARRPTCPSGRTFLWWLGDHYEPEPPNGNAVMGFFTGGAQRLSHSFLEIQPAKLWRKFGWRMDETNPLQWRKGAEVVATYQRIHGPPRGSSRGPHHRQPLLHRWIVCESAFKTAAEGESLSFRLREDFVRMSGEFEK